MVLERMGVLGRPDRVERSNKEFQHQEVTEITLGTRLFLADTVF